VWSYELEILDHHEVTKDNLFVSQVTRSWRIVFISRPPILTNPISRPRRRKFKSRCTFPAPVVLRCCVPKCMRTSCLLLCSPQDYIVFNYRRSEGTSDVAFSGDPVGRIRFASEYAEGLLDQRDVVFPRGRGVLPGLLYYLCERPVILSLSKSSCLHCLR